ncbi:MAG TPA: SRPBCC family protein [Polyangiaceae bacterium]|nr:SRPBCC family protein [Polyangiaceae bacterium]
MKTNAFLPALSLSALLSVGCGPSLSSMHARAAVGEVEPDAPLHTTQSVTVAAPRARVWALFTAFGAWPTWQPNITRVTPPGALEPGAKFTWVNGGTEISSTLAVVRPTEMLAWTGSVATAKAIHVWRFSSPTPETTRVEVDETMDGFLLTWFYGQKDLDAEIARSLRNLRKAAESTSPALRTTAGVAQN